MSPVPFSRRRHLLPLLCAVAVPLFCPCLGSAPFSVCANRCCTVLPSCRAALRVSCHCDLMSLRKGDMPQSVLAIHIMNAKNLVIYKDAVNDLKHLTNFSVRGADRVEIRENGMAFEEKSKIRSVTFQDVRELRIKSKAFSGVWETKTSISISDTSELRVSSNAFEHRSTTSGPSLAIGRIGMLHLDSNGILGPLYSLNMDNVIMDTCLEQSFSGKIVRIMLNKMLIDEAKPRCASNLEVSSSFSIHSSKLNAIHPQAFSGIMYDMNIKDSNFSSMHERGFDIQTVNMRISDSHFKTLNSRGLSATAKGSIRLENMRVDFLGKNALAGLKIQRTTGGFTQAIATSKLNILTAEEGSLSFSDCAEVRMDGLALETPWPPVCPTEQWARQLTGAAPSGPLSTSQFEVLMQMLDRSRCAEDAGRRYPKQSPNCELPVRMSGELLRDQEDNSYGYETVGDRRDAGSQEDGKKDKEADDRMQIFGGVGGEQKKTTVSRDVEKDSSRDFEVEDTTSVLSSDTSVVTIETLPVAAGHGQPVPTASLPTQVGPAASRPVAVGPEYRGPSASRSASQHVLLLYLTLGAVLALLAVLSAVLLLLAVRRRRRRPGSADERLAAVLVQRLCGSGEAGLPQAAVPRSAPPSADCHQYEAIREELLLPPPLVPAPPPPDQVSILYGGSRASSHLYDFLLDR